MINAQTPVYLCTMLGYNFYQDPIGEEIPVWEGLYSRYVVARNEHRAETVFLARLIAGAEGGYLPTTDERKVEVIKLTYDEWRRYFDYEGLERQAYIDPEWTAASDTTEAGNDLTPTSTITAEQYDAGASLEGVTAIDFGPVVSVPVAADEAIILPLVHESVQWRPIKETYPEAQIPNGWGYICLLDGDSGTMLGAFFENFKEPGVFRLKVHTPAGLINATLLGCQFVAIIADCPHSGFQPEQFQTA